MDFREPDTYPHHLDADDCEHPRCGYCSECHTEGCHAFSPLCENRLILKALCRLKREGQNVSTLPLSECAQQVRIVLFTNYQCLISIEALTEALPEIIDDYLQGEGKV